MIDYSAGLKIAGVLFGAALLLAISGAMINAYRVHRKQMRRVRTIIRSEHDRSIIGDGAWLERRPRARAEREAEPRGM